MNLDNLQNKLIAAARTAQPNDRVPYAFEKRVMARLAEARIDLLGAWSAALWRAAIGCVAVVALASALSIWNSPQPVEADFSQEFETAVFASAGSSDEVW
jgi:hypothetical protein